MTCERKPLTWTKCLVYMFVWYHTRRQRFEVHVCEKPLTSTECCPESCSCNVTPCMCVGRGAHARRKRGGSSLASASDEVSGVAESTIQPSFVLRDSGWAREFSDRDCQFLQCDGVSGAKRGGRLTGLHGWRHVRHFLLPHAAGGFLSSDSSRNVPEAPCSFMERLPRSSPRVVCPSCSSSSSLRPSARSSGSHCFTALLEPNKRAHVFRTQITSSLGCRFISAIQHVPRTPPPKPACAFWTYHGAGWRDRLSLWEREPSMRIRAISVLAFWRCGVVE